MAEQTVTKQLRLYFLANDISLGDAAKKTGYHYKHLSYLLNRNDLSNDQRERILKAYPDATFLIPAWTQVEGE